METREVGPIEIVFDSKELRTASLIQSASEQALTLCQEIWGLDPPRECRIHVMTSWFSFFFRSSPWPWRLMLGLTVPLWAPRARRTWPISAAWTQRYGRRVAIGVKPPRLIQASKTGTGPRVFVEEPDMAINVQGVVCHELVHACSAHLRLPAWLNEGIATLTTDRFLGQSTIRAETLELVDTYQPKGPPPTYRALSRIGLGEAFAYHAVRGYWITHYLEERRAGFLKSLFAQESGGRDYGNAIAAEFDKDQEAFWREIDGLVVEHFEIKV